MTTEWTASSKKDDAYQEMSFAQNVDVVLVIFAQVCQPILLVQAVEVGLPTGSKAFERLSIVAMVTKISID